MNWVQPKFNDFAVPPAKKQKTSSKSGSRIKCFMGKPEEITCFDKWKPKKKSELVVHKKKLEEIESWLDDMTNKHGSSFLLLYGPPGCGKLTSLRVLCNECGINLCEWLPQVPLNTYNPESVSNIQYQSEISLFEDFVMRASRYSNVLNRNSSRVIVVKDIPSQYRKDPNLFNLFLAKYEDIDDVNLVFIVTDYKTTRELFSDNVKMKFNFKTIQFNPITQRNTLIALQKIAKGKHSSYLNSISLSCGGDLRNAIATLQFLSVKGSLPEKKSDKSSEDNFVDIFHAIGRVLYAKRDTDGKLRHCPIDLAESFTSTPELFLNMLQENYLETFSSIHSIAKASKSLGTSAVLLKHPSYINFSSESLSIASFALMSYNSNPVKKFQQFNRPTTINDYLSEYRSLSKDSESLVDTISFGRFIPSFSVPNKKVLMKIKPFGLFFL